MVTVLERYIYLSRHQLLKALHTALGALEPLPVSMKTVSQHIRDCAKKDPKLCPCLQNVKSSCPHSNTCLSTTEIPVWAMSIHQLLDGVVHHADQFLSVVAEPLVVGPRHAPQRLLIDVVVHRRIIPSLWLTTFPPSFQSTMF